MIKELNSDWTLRQANDSHNDHAMLQYTKDIPFSIPGDVHSALLHAGHIDEPYYRDNELAVDWVNRCEWLIEREFEIELPAPANRSAGKYAVLVLDQVDCIADVYLNDTLVGKTESQFIRYAFDVQPCLKHGLNKIHLHFHSAVKVAAQKAAEFPFELPHSANCRLPHSNFLRKTPCHAGWDWNICLMPTGIYLSLIHI